MLITQLQCPDFINPYLLSRKLPFSPYIVPLSISVSVIRSSSLCGKIRILLSFRKIFRENNY